MHSACGRYIISFNGEIYNFLELRRELEALGHQFRGHSDTRSCWLPLVSGDSSKPWSGLMVCLFAFALWDRQQRRLYLGRDRLGEKPLYYGWRGKTFFFASELKAIKAHPHFQAEINQDALALYLRHSYIPAPYSIYQGIYKLPPAHLLPIKPDSATAEPVSYWSAQLAAESGIANPFTGSETEVIAALDALLREAVGLRMVADVPLGAFLSGGIDSSTIVALMQAQSRQPVKTFSIGFYEESYNEAQHAKAVAQHLGTDHTELYVTSQEAMGVIPRLPHLYDEPFSDSSQIPTFLVSQLARQHVTVSLSGNGGDELFGGYNRYFRGDHIWRQKHKGKMPATMRQVAARGLSAIAPQSGIVVFLG